MITLPESRQVKKFNQYGSFVYTFTANNTSHPILRELHFELKMTKLEKSNHRCTRFEIERVDEVFAKIWEGGYIGVVKILGGRVHLFGVLFLLHFY